MKKIPLYEEAKKKDLEKELMDLYEEYVNLNEGKNATESDIVKAIKNRTYVGIYYEELSDKTGKIVEKGFRLIEPYVIGRGYVINGKTYYPDRVYVRAFVIRDSYYDSNKGLKKISRRKSVSKTKKVPYWRLFRLDRIQKFNKFNIKFSSYRELYNPNDKQVATIIYKIEKEDFPNGEIPNK